ncbi:DNA excision repair protein ERCC-6-like 2 [Marchantia polymorpha subsp. ruderalis]
MAYKAFKELFQNCTAPLSSQPKPLGDDGAERKPLKTSLRDRISLLDRQVKTLTSGPTLEPNSIKEASSISPPVLPLTTEDSPWHGADKKDLVLLPCSRTSADDENLGFISAKECRSSGFLKRKFDAIEKTEAPTAEVSTDFPFKDVSSTLRSVKPQPTVSLPATAVEKIEIIDDDDDGIEDEEEDTQSLIHALEDEDDNGGHEVDKLLEPQVALEPLVLWPPPGEGPSTGSGEVKRVEVPASINSRLLDHQREGVAFLYKLYRSNHGGILGDDMGLGKTIQSIALLAAIFEKKDAESVGAAKAVVQRRRCEKVALIICPTSVLQNWDQEIEAWGEFRVGTYFGLQREVVLGKIKAKEVEIVLTSHDTFRIHGEELCKIKWDLVIVDEAHRLKNDKSHLYMKCMQLPTKRRFGLTGTVMQNTYLELFNVFEWATPGCLGSREHFKEYYSGPIKEGQRISAPKRFVVIAEDRQKHLLSVLRKYFLRRTKQQTIAHLMNGKEDNVIFCSMTPAQKRVYRRILQSPDFQALIGKAMNCTCGSPLKRGQCCYRIVPKGIIWSYLHKDSLDDGCDYCPNCLVLPCLTKLQQVSNHLELIKPNPNDDATKQAKDYDFAKLALGEDAHLVGGVSQETNFLGLSHAQHCGKMLALEKLLSSWISEGDKVLLFSYSVKMLDILDKFLIRKGYCFSRLDGSTPMSARQSLVEDFNTSPSKQIFLISTRAGGLGLNLVSANRVLIFDPNWNPSHDLQAQDRSFRYGQVRHVTVYRLLAAGSLEELIYTRQIYKQQLFNIGVSGANEKRYFEGVQGSKEHKGELFGIDNLLRDLSDEVFAEGIIEDHEERLLRVQHENAVQVKEIGEVVHAETDGVEDVESSQGDHTYRTPSVTNDKDLRDKNARDDKKERKMQRRVQSALTSAGVLYAHRNEDVVNMGSSDLGASNRNWGSADAPRENRRKQIQAKPHVQSAGTPRIRKASIFELSEVRPDEKFAERSSASEANRPASSKDSKDVFADLAKFKGLTTSEFSVWFLSADKDERTQLRLDYQKSRQK